MFFKNTTAPDTVKESRTIMDSLREAFTAPLTAITETIQTAVSNLQSDKQEVATASDIEQEVSTEDQSSKTEEQTTEQEKDDVQPLQAIAPTADASPDRQESYDSFITDTTILTSSESTNVTAEPVDEQEDTQETAVAPSETSVRSSFDERVVVCMLDSKI